MAYVAKTFVAGEQPSAAEWNKLTANDASFHDGTGIDDSVILTRHILDSNITGAKLDLITRSGWLPLTALTRVSDTTATLVGDWTDRIPFGAKIRWLSAGSLRQNYIVGVSYSAGTGLTTITITNWYQASANDSNFKSGDAITVMQFSIAASPVGFTPWFSYIPTIYGTGGSAGTFAATYLGRVCLRDRVCFINNHCVINNKGSWSSEVRITLPLAIGAGGSQDNMLTGYWCASGANMATGSRGIATMGAAGATYFNIGTGVAASALDWSGAAVGDRLRLAGSYEV